MELLKKLYQVHSPSGKEEPMRKFIIKWAKDHGLKAQKDRTGNLYISKGEAETYPCIVAHMDEVHDVRPENFKIVVYKDNYILGGDADILRPAGIGADDKNGIWCALRLLERVDCMKAAFFIKEEVGCVGSNAADMSFFDDCRFVLQADRRGGSDLIINASGTELCNPAFIKKMHPDNYGYKGTNGMMTDVMTLKRRGLAVACANISCGYYNPHTVDEYTNFAELENCLAFIENAFKTIVDVCPHRHVEKYDIKYDGRGMNSRYPFMGGVYYEDLPDDRDDKRKNNGSGSSWPKQW